MSFSNRKIEKTKPTKQFVSDIPFHANAVYEKQKQKSEKYTGGYSMNAGIKKKKPLLFWRILKFLFWAIFDICLLAGILLLGWIFYIASQAPDLDKMNSSAFEQSSVLYDKTGEKVLYQLIGDYKREVLTSIEDVSIHMRNAMLAAEDANFYEHSGVSIRGIARGVRDSLSGKSSGGSTITQQLIKMVYFPVREKEFEKKVERKIKEIVLARALEKKYSKDEILLLYLNKSPFRGNIYGVEKASKAFFGKSAKDLTIAESAVLAGLPQAPSRYQRTPISYITLDQSELDALNITNFEDLVSRQQSGEISYRTFVRGIFGTEYTFAHGATDYIPGRADYVLGQMREKQFISESEYEQAKEEMKHLEIKEFKDVIQAPHFTFYAQEELHSILKELYELDDAGVDTFLHTNGLKITTTIDLKLNNEVQRIISENGDKAEEGGFNIRNAAGLVLDSKTGAILSMVGSRDYYATEINGNKFDGAVNVLTSRRQPGSTFKAIAYAAAFELKGLSPATVLMDVKTNLSLNPKKNYTPRNYDGTFNGPVSVREALGRSLNIPAVKVGIIVGIKELTVFSQLLGLVYQEDTNRFGPAMSLGAPTVRPLDMGAVFATFANEGKKVTPYAIEKITTADGQVLYSREKVLEEKKQEQVLSPQTAFLITSILSDETGAARPKSWNKSLSIPGRPSAAKTGTSTGVVNGVTHPHDVWTIGYTPQRTALVWMGNNEGWEENPKGVLHDRASGLTNAAVPWRDIMIAAHKTGESAEQIDLDVEKFKKPEGIKKIAISILSGKIPPSDFPQSLIRSEFFNVKFLPSKEDTTFKRVELEKESLLLPNEFTPKTATEEFTYIEFHSYFPENPAWEDPIKKWLEEDGLKFVEKLGLENFIPFVPKEYTSLYSEDTQSNAPKISILSPSNMGIVSPPLVNVEVDVRAKNNIKSVDLMWNGKLIASKKSSPWVFTIPLQDAPINSLHVLEASVTDMLGYTDIVSVNVKVGEDRLPPEVEILYPQPNAELEKGSLVQIGVEAIDKNSSVKKINIFLDDRMVETLLTRPYQYSWNVDVSAGSHVLKVVALDSAGNTATESIPFTVIESERDVVEREQFLGNGENSKEIERVFAITQPSGSSTFSGVVPISFSIPVRMREGGVKISVMARKVGGKKDEIFMLDGSRIPKSGLASFSWSPQETGEYSVYLQATGDAKDFSSKVRVVVE